MTERVVIVGGGMAAVRLAEQLVGADVHLTVLADEPHAPYNRILLSSVLAGEKTSEDIALNPIEWYERNNIQLRVGSRVTAVASIASSTSMVATTCERAAGSATNGVVSGRFWAQS